MALLDMQGMTRAEDWGPFGGGFGGGFGGAFGFRGGFGEGFGLNESFCSFVCCVPFI